MLRRWHLAVFAVLAALALACEGSGQQAGTGTTKPPAKGYPSSIAALGDSITAGVGSCAIYAACWRNSWSTGSSTGVQSHYLRIRAKNPKIKGHVANYAEPGARARDLAGQAASAVKSKAAYVTVLIGANDICSGGAAAMTPVRTFRDQIDSGLARLKKGLPKAHVLVVSIPDLHRLWELGHDDPRAVRAWNRGICPAMLANPTSTAAADDKRRRLVADRIDQYDHELAEACQAYGSRCRWDGGAVHGVRFSLDLVNRSDYFHPNAEGQKRLAEATYPGRINW
ncbi:MAG TPA: SGNH/GDSL hydrolase family protein [Actinoplanes sp.]|jgi:lysophospholipase L1-like esterase